MKTKKISIKYQIALYILFFSFGLIFLLWTFQIYLLPNIFQTIKDGNVKSANQEILQVIDQKDFEEQFINITENKGVCALVINKNKNYFTANGNSDCMLDKLSNGQIKEYYNLAKKNNNHYLVNYNTSDVKRMGKGEGLKKNKMGGCLLYVQIVPETGQMVLTSANVKPLPDTIEALNKVFLILSAILVLLAIVMGYVVSKKISKPIKILSDKVKNLASGDYSVVFDQSENLEIAELSESLNYTTQELGQVDALRKEVLANVSHDLKTPLTMIISYAELIRDIPKECTTDNIQVVIDEANYLNHLVSDILDINKYEDKQQSLNISEFKLNDLINDIVDNTRSIYKVPVNFSYKDEVFVRADSLKIKQVMLNLLNNAQDYANSEIDIKLELVDKRIKVSVVDDGEGIPYQLQKYLWERYYRMHKGDKAHSGLGLSIVAKILDLHGFEYGINSEVGKGSEFFFYLETIANNK